MSFDFSNPEKLRECLQSHHWRMRNLYWITDKWGKKVLFKPNSVQEAIEEALHWANLVLKSRQHGVTTWACLTALDAILFTSNFRAGIVAHTAGDATAFFRKKILFAYDNLPDWIRRRRVPVRRDMKEGVLEFANGSSIEVSVSHRGGTLNFLHVSEYGPMCAIFPERAKEVASGALNAIKVGPPPDGDGHGNLIVIESTAHGATGDFHGRCQTAIVHDRLVRAGAATLTEMDYKFHFFPWFADPQNTTDPRDVPISEQMAAYFEGIEEEMGIALSNGQRAWYVKKAIEQKENMRREHPSTPKEAFDAAIDGAYYGKQMALAENEGRIGAYPFVPGRPVHTFWDIGKRDATAIWFMQENGGWFDFIRYYEVWGEQSATAAREIARLATEEGYVYGKHYLPHDIEVTEWVGMGDNRSRKAILEDSGVKPIVTVPKIENELEGIDLLRGILYRCRFDATNCGPPDEGGKLRGGLEAVRQFKKDWNEKQQQWYATPKIDWTNHGADSLRGFAQSFSPDKPIKKDKGQQHKGEESWKTL